MKVDRDPLLNTVIFLVMTVAERGSILRYILS